MSEVTIRQALDSDLKTILSLYAQDDFNGDAVSAEMANEIFQRQQQCNGFSLFVAEIDGALLGTYCLMVMENISAMGRPSAIIESVVVAQSARGSGLGTHMLNHAIETAREAGCYKACLFTSTSAHYVHEFYEKLGFQQHGVSYLTNLPEQAAQ